MHTEIGDQNSVNEDGNTLGPWFESSKLRNDRRRILVPLLEQFITGKRRAFLDVARRPLVQFGDRILVTE